MADRQPLVPIENAVSPRNLGSPSRRQPLLSSPDLDDENTFDGPARKRARIDDFGKVSCGASASPVALQVELQLRAPAKARSLPTRLFHRETAGIPGMYKQTKSWFRIWQLP